MDRRRGRDGHRWSPLAQIRTCAFTHTALTDGDSQRSVRLVAQSLGHTFPMRSLSANLTSTGPSRQNRKGAKHLVPFLTLIGFHSDQFSCHLLEATRETCSAARHNQVSAGVEYFQLDGIGELVRTPV